MEEIYIRRSIRKFKEQEVEPEKKSISCCAQLCRLHRLPISSHGNSLW